MKRAAKDSRIIAIVAANVRAARKAARLSQEELAFEAQVDRTYVSQVERKQRNITVSVLARIAEALGVTPDKLLIPSGVPTTKKSGRKRS
jgi:transcriptional regulator with XRE-family HTH domain